MDNGEKSFNDLVSEKLKKKKRKIKRHTVIIAGLCILLILSTLVMFKEIGGKKSSLKSIGIDCHGAKMLGVLGYNKETHTLYMNKVYFCSGKDALLYDKINAVLYENGDTPTVVLKFAPGSNTMLEDYIKQLYFEQEDYLETCHLFDNDSLYLEVTTQKGDGEKIFKVALDQSDSCLE